MSDSRPPRPPRWTARADGSIFAGGFAVLPPRPKRAGGPLPKKDAEAVAKLHNEEVEAERHRADEVERILARLQSAAPEGIGPAMAKPEEVLRAGYMVYLLYADGERVAFQVAQNDDPHRVANVLREAFVIEKPVRRLV